jgi:hypothetical protein
VRAGSTDDEEQSMKYMILINASVSSWKGMGEWTPDDVKVMVGVMNELNDELVKNGELVDANGLSGPAFAKIVQAQQGGDTVVTDGPFSEAKEFLAGYWIVDVADEARAIEIAVRASACPGAGGVPLNQPIEVHPVSEGPLV